MTTLDERVTPQELARAWEAVRAGQFRTAIGRGPARTGRRGDGSTPGEHWWRERAVVAVVGAHGWSGASTTALLLAHSYAAAGRAVRLLDGATPARSGLVAAALTEHGVDETGRWRVGTRGAVAVQRPAEQLATLADLPDPHAGPPGAEAVSVVDTGWPLGQLLDEPGWMSRLVRAVPLVVTGRASALGVRHVEATLAALHAAGASTVVVALIGPTRRGRIPARVSSIAGAGLTAAIQARRVVMLPDLPALAGAGIGAAELPRRLGRPDTSWCRCWAWRSRRRPASHRRDP